MRRLEGKTALVTGGAQGIGFEGAKLFAEEGARVVIADINAEKGEKAAAEIGAVFVRCDVSRAADVENAVKTAGTVDVLYNNAGIFWTGHDGKITDISESDWDRVIGINLKSVYLFSKYSIPTMIKAGGGSIVNTGSSAAQIGIPDCDAYTATKGAIVQLTKSLAV